MPFDKYGILLYHPVTTELPHLEENIRNVVDAVMSSGRDFVVIDPNNDHGSEIIRNELKTTSGKDRFCLRTSMRFEHFLTLLRHAQVIVGNSSAGVREAPGVRCPDHKYRQQAKEPLSPPLDLEHCRGSRCHPSSSWPLRKKVSHLFTLAMERVPSCFFGSCEMTACGKHLGKSISVICTSILVPLQPLSLKDPGT